MLRKIIFHRLYRLKLKLNKFWFDECIQKVWAFVVAGVGIYASILAIRTSVKLFRNLAKMWISLFDHHGQEINLDKLKGSVFVADFFYTSCAGICTRMTEQMTRLQEAIKDEQRDKLVSFTVAPERDSVWVLSEYAKGWGAIEVAFIKAIIVKSKAMR